MSCSPCDFTKNELRISCNYFIQSQWVFFVIVFMMFLKNCEFSFLWKSVVNSSKMKTNVQRCEEKPVKYITFWPFTYIKLLIDQTIHEIICKWISHNEAKDFLKSHSNIEKYKLYLTFSTSEIQKKQYEKKHLQ